MCLCGGVRRKGAGKGVANRTSDHADTFEHNKGENNNITPPGFGKMLNCMSVCGGGERVCMLCTRNVCNVLSLEREFGREVCTFCKNVSNTRSFLAVCKLFVCECTERFM